MMIHVVVVTNSPFRDCQIRLSVKSADRLKLFLTFFIAKKDGLIGYKFLVFILEKSSPKNIYVNKHEQTLQIFQFHNLF